ncbi:MAG: PIN domain nuclease [Candidatus Acidiferrum sp.]
MIIVDTTVWVDYLRGRRNPETDWLDRELGREEFGLTDLILCEVLQGVRSEKDFGHTRIVLGEFALFSTGGEELAIAAARNYRTIREEGITVRKTIDCMIATFCMSKGYALLHQDRDFDAFEKILGMAVIHP